MVYSDPTIDRLPPDARKRYDQVEQQVSQNERQQQADEARFWDEAAERMERGLGESMTFTEQAEVFGSISLCSPRGGWPVFDKTGKVITSLSPK